MMETTENNKDMTENTENQFCVETIRWLAGHLGTDANGISDILNESNAQLFMFIWPVFEEEIFNSFAVLNNKKPKSDSTKKDLATVTNEFKNQYKASDFDNMAKRFHSRYKDCNERYEALIDYKRVNTIAIIEMILYMDYENITNSYEKLYLLFFVTYRYRNNIFHGNKNILSWPDYKEQIRDCITFMIKIIDINNLIKNRKTPR